MAILTTEFVLLRQVILQIQCIIILQQIIQGNKLYHSCALLLILIHAQLCNFTVSPNDAAQQRSTAAAARHSWREEIEGMRCTMHWKADLEQSVFAPDSATRHGP